MHRWRKGHHLSLVCPMLAISGARSLVVCSSGGGSKAVSKPGAKGKVQFQFATSQERGNHRVEALRNCIEHRVPVVLIVGSSDQRCPHDLTWPRRHLRRALSTKVCRGWRTTQTCITQCLGTIFLRTAGYKALFRGILMGLIFRVLRPK